MRLSNKQYRPNMGLNQKAYKPVSGGTKILGRVEAESAMARLKKQPALEAKMKQQAIKRLRQS